MGAVLTLVAGLLLVVEVVLVVRLVLDWTAVLAGPSTTGSRRSAAHRAVLAVTEPLLAPVRRVVRPVRVGTVAVDLSFAVVLLAVVAVRSVLLSAGT